MLSNYDNPGTNTTGPNDWTALMFAVGLNDRVRTSKEVKIVKLLLEDGKADPNQQNADGWTALMLAANRIWVSDIDVEITKLLLDKGANRSLKNKNNKTALDLASGKSVDPMGKSNLDIVKLLRPKDMPYASGPDEEPEIYTKIPILPAVPTYASPAAPAAPTYASPAAPTYASPAAPAPDSNPSSPNDGGPNTGLIIGVVVTCVVVLAIVAGFILLYCKKSKEDVPWQSSLPGPPAQAAAKPGGSPKRDWREFGSPKRELKEFGSPRRMPENSPNGKFRAGESADSANKQRMNLPKGFSGERSPYDKSPKGGMREKNFSDKSPTSALGKKQLFSWEIANESLSPRTRKFPGDSKLRPLNG